MKYEIALLLGLTKAIITEGTCTKSVPAFQNIDAERL